MTHGERISALEIELREHEASHKNKDDILAEMESMFAEKDQMIQKHKSKNLQFIF